MMIYSTTLQGRQRRFEKEEGSITVFLALTLALILSFLFSMLELSRVKALQGLVKREFQLEAESLLGAYNQELWQDYGLLFLNTVDEKGKPDIRIIEQCLLEESGVQEKENHFYRLMMKDAQVEKYALATDAQGAEFRRQACKAAKESLTKEGMEYLKQQIMQGSRLEEESSSLEQKWNDALSAEDTAREIAEAGEEEKAEEKENENKADINREEGENKDLPENPMAYVSQLKSSPLLAMVLEDPSELSGKGIDISTAIDRRELSCGNLSAEQENSVDKLWFIQYLNQYFTCGAEEKSTQHALDYELEYCICGKETDAENLEGTVKRLLLLREAGNFITIMQDVEKKALAMEIAAAAIGFTGLLPLVKALQIGILLAWSYVESITDLRGLLAGGKVPLVKTGSEWKSDLFHIKETTQKTGAAEEKGLSYREYLQILLFLTGQEKLTYRAMDIVERNIRISSGNSCLRMDAMVSAIKINAVYTANPLFFNLVPIEKRINGNYQFEETKIFAY